MHGVFTELAQGRQSFARVHLGGAKVYLLGLIACLGFQNTAEAASPAAVFALSSELGIAGVAAIFAFGLGVFLRPYLLDKPKGLDEDLATYRDHYENAPDMFASVDAKTKRILACNQTLAKQLGKTKEQIVGAPLVDLYHPDCLPQVQVAFDSFVETGSVKDVLLQLRRADGAKLDVSLSVSAVLNDAGEVVRSRSIWRDATARRTAERELESSERRFRATFDQSAVGIAHVSPTGKFIRVNRGLCQMIGYSEAELLEKTFIDITHEDDLDLDLDYVQRVIKGDIQTYTMEKRYFHRDNEIIWINLTVSLVRDSEGEPEYFISIIEDISSRKRAEQALKKNRERVQAGLVGANEGIWDWPDVNKDTEWWSPVFYSLLGYKNREIRPSLSMFKELLHPDDRPTVFAAVEAHFADETPFDVECRLQSKDGTYRWFRSRARAQRNEAGEPVRMSGSISDIQQVKDAEEQRERSNERFASVIAATRDPIAAVDASLRHTAFNSTYSLFMGAVSGKVVEYGNRTTKYVEHWKKALSGEAHKVTVVIHKNSENERTYELSFNPIRSASMEISGAALVGRDISSRAEFERSLQRLNRTLRRRRRELQNSNEELEAFTYSVSHDLRAPVRHLTGFVELLRKRASGELDDTSKKYLEHISGSAERMGQLIDDLLEFSRTGRAQVSHRLVNHELMVREVIEEQMALNDGRKVIWKIDPLRESNCDVSLLRQVWTNLISNALKFTRNRKVGRIRISCEFDPTEEDIVYKVKDNGAGFDMKYVEKLFGVFQRLHHREEFEGTGIGLALVSRIIHRHGGSCAAFGREGRGARLEFSLPIVADTDADELSENEADKPASAVKEVDGAMQLVAPLETTSNT